MTWPRDVGQVPIFYAHYLTQIPSDRDAMYWDGSSAPLYPFGYGLSYAGFEVKDLWTADQKVKAGEKLTVSVEIRNTSAVAGDEVLQLYTHQRSGSASRPVRELKGFRRVTLQSGERKTVELTLDTNDLGFWSAATHHWSIEPGTFDLWVGTDSTAKEHATFTVVQ